MLMYMNCSRETSILALKVPGSTRLYFQIKRGLPMKLINTPLRCDTTFSTFASTYHAMIHLTVRKLKSWLFVNFVTKGLHYFDNLGGKGRRGKQEGTGRAEMITWIYKKMYHGKSNLKHFWKLMCYIISFFCDILKRKKKLQPREQVSVLLKQYWKECENAELLCEGVHSTIDVLQFTKPPRGGGGLLFLHNSLNKKPFLIIQFTHLFY